MWRVCGRWFCCVLPVDTVCVGSTLTLSGLGGRRAWGSSVGGRYETIPMRVDRWVIGRLSQSVYARAGVCGVRRANATSVGEFFLRHDVPGNKDARRVLTPAREDSGLFYFVFTPATGTSARARLTRAGGGGGAQGDGAESGDAGPVSAPSAGGFWAGVSAPNAGGWPRMPGDGPARRGHP